MEVSNSVKVAARIRPQNDREQVLHYPVSTKAADLSVTIKNDKIFSFDYVFDQTACQAEVYTACVKDLVAGVFNGLNATVLAYGQTGSGKTYTMGTGFELGAANPEVNGIVPRAVDQIFDTIHELKMRAKELDEFEPRFTIEAQFIELYNEDLVDLLTRDRSAIVRIQENPDNGQIVIKNAISMQVSSSDEVLGILRSGAINRTTGSTNMNEKSSRSHAIFSLHIKQEKFEPTDGDDKLLAVLTAKLHFVDLAGSERLKRTGATGERAKEGISINCGLLALGNVISALTGPKKTHVPYRDSKLTRLLQDSLGGNSQTLMIACASPNSVDATETTNTLTYATRAKAITNHVMVNKDHDAATVSQLKSRIQVLETKLADYEQGKYVVQQQLETKCEQNVEIDLVETFGETSNSVLKSFKQLVDGAIGNKPQIESLVKKQQELIELSEKFKNDLEALLHVLQIPPRSKTRKERRDTIFDSDRMRKGRDRKTVTTLMSIPSFSFDEAKPSSPKKGKLSDEGKENDHSALIVELQREVAMYKERAERAEEESRYNAEKASNTIEHLHKSIMQLKNDANIFIKKE